MRFLDVSYEAWDQELISQAQAFPDTSHFEATRGCGHEPDPAAKLNGHDPYRYLKDILERLPTHPASRLMKCFPTAGPTAWLSSTDVKMLSPGAYGPPSVRLSFSSGGWRCRSHDRPYWTGGLVCTDWAA